jgi:hypothetical protein
MRTPTAARLVMTFALVPRHSDCESQQTHEPFKVPFKT